MQNFIHEPKIFYTDTGQPEGPPVVLIHAFPFSHEMWLPQVEVLNERWRVVTYDIRGFGRSDPGDGEFTIDQYVDDLFLLLDALQIEQATVVGLSMGGYILLRAFEREPGRFRALVLSSTKSAADDEAARTGRERAIDTIHRQGLRFYAEDFAKKVFAPQTFTLTPQIIDHQLEIIETHPPIGLQGALRALASRPDTTAVLDRIAVPTLLLFGEEDSVTPPALGRAMQGRIVGSELVVIPQAAHLCNLEHPEVYNAHLLSFLEGLGG